MDNNELNQLFQRAVQLHEAGELSRAIDSYQIILKKNPQLITVYNYLALALRTLNRNRAAYQCLQQCLKNNAEHPTTLNLLAVVLTDLKQIDKAKELHQYIMQKYPNFIDNYINYANILADEGHNKQAETLYRKALAQNPYQADALHHLSLIKKYSTSKDPDFHLLESALKQADLKNQQKILLHFALGKMHDDCQNYDTAFTHFKLGNDLKNTHCNFNKDNFIKFFCDIQQTFTKPLIEHFHQQANPSHLPVFIVGMPRSGSTLVEQIIASHPHVYGAGELYAMEKILNQLPFEINNGKRYPLCVTDMTLTNAKKFADFYLRSLSISDKNIQRTTDKMPSNFFNLGLIACLFKNAKIIHCQRNPVDTCLSNYFQLFATRNDYAYSFENLVLAYQQYQNIMAHWDNVLPLAVLNIQYEDLIKDFTNQTKKIIEFLGLKWDAACLSFYKSTRHTPTASTWQVRQPIYKSSVGRWHHYQQHILQLIQQLSPDA